MSYGTSLYNSTPYNGPRPVSTLSRSGRYGYGPSRYIYRNTVDLYRRIAAKDRDKATIGGLYTLLATSIRCSVQPGEIRSRYTAEDKIEQFIPYEIYFEANPIESQYDMTIWIDDAGTTHEILVVGTRSLAGRGIAWVIDGEERV